MYCIYQDIVAGHFSVEELCTCRKETMWLKDKTSKHPAPRQMSNSAQTVHVWRLMQYSMQDTEVYMDKSNPETRCVTFCCICCSVFWLLLWVIVALKACLLNCNVFCCCIWQMRKKNSLIIVFLFFLSLFLVGNSLTLSLKHTHIHWTHTISVSEKWIMEIVA